jgi:oligopeptide transport system substrate-binding protein
MRKSIILIKLFTILLSIILFSNCRKNSSGVNFGYVNVPLSSEISTLDPANSYDTISASVVYQGYEQLYEYHYLKRPYTLKPLLADGMPKISKDGKTYTINIKKNIRYHDDPAFNGKTRFLNAQDFITQLKRLAYLPTKSNGWWLFDGRIEGINDFRNSVGSDFSKFQSENISGIKALSSHKLEIKLTKPYPQMLYTLAMSFTTPMPIEVVIKYKNLLHDKMIGTGPFELVKWNKNSSLKLVKFKHYRETFYPRQGDRQANSLKLLTDAGKRLPFLKGVNFTIIKESQTRWLNFRSKKIDFLIIPKDNYASAIDHSGSLSKELLKDKIKLQIFPTLTYWWLSFNMTDPLLGKNLLLRKAIAHAVNVEKYITFFTNNIGQKANSIYPPGIPGYDPAGQLPYGYNLKLAKKYLAQAGYPEGKGLPTLNYDVRGASATNRQQADFIKIELAKIGINVKVSLNTFPGFLKKMRNGKLQFWQDGWAMDYPDAENSLQLLATKNHSPGPNATFYSNKKFDAYFEELKTIPDGFRKKYLMREMEKIVHEELPWIMQYYARNYILYHNHLKNYRHSDLIYNNMKYLRTSEQ